MQCVYNRTTAMSKLKRKKLSVEDYKSEQQTLIKKLNDSRCSVALQDSSCATTSTGSRERWWESSELSDAERLWALTLTALCPNLQSDDLEESIPQLPPPSSTKSPVQTLSDWRWCNGNKDVNPPPGLPAPSFLVHPPPANDLKNPSQPPAEENTRASDPPSLSDQEKHASSPDGDSVPVCSTKTTQQRKLDNGVNCLEDCKLLDDQGDRFGQARNVSETRRSKAESRTVRSVEWKSAEIGAGKSESGIRTFSGAEGPALVLETKQEASGSGSGQEAKTGAGQRAKSGVREFGLGTGTKSGIAEGAKSGLGRNSIASGSGLDLGTKSGASGSGLVLGTKSGASGSGLVLGTKSGASGSGLVLGAKSGSGQEAKSGLVRSGSGLVQSGTVQEEENGLMVFRSGLGTNASGSKLGMETKSGTEWEAKSGIRGSGTNSVEEKIANSGSSKSGLGLETKSGTEQEAKSGTRESGTNSGEEKLAKSGLGRSGANSGASRSGSGLETTRSPEGSESGLETKSGAEHRSELECCPMCLMPFPAGFTQMECDGHLAQCLSEMHDDIIW
nr:protein SPT2 homolog isoform X2 [Danio rerio]|eukprot:XP_021327707.1 protein SPT2 homolog isoform X2 [Danio rerio]